MTNTETKKENRLRVAVIVSPDISDIYFANSLIKELNVVGVVVEQQNEKRSGERNKASKLFSGILSPFSSASKIKRKLTKRANDKKATKVNYEGFGKEGLQLIETQNIEFLYTTGVRSINRPEYVAQIEAMKPDIIAVCGASILKAQVINIPRLATLNLHGGLSQWYRGVWTTMWAIYNSEPEYIGATVHYVSAGIDDGDIILQGRPEIESIDNQESLYVKVVKLGINMMIWAITKIEDGTVVRHPLKMKGKLYLCKQATPEIVSEAWRKTDSGIINDYLKDRKRRDAKVIIHDER
jgi:methionyl-tRNA formyltransferase